MKLTDAIKIIPQHILPHHALSAVMYKLTRSKVTMFKNFAIRLIVKIYNVEMQDAVVTDPEKYASFNHFFTRALRPETRPVCNETTAIASPVDGKVSQVGKINANRIFQAKGHDYTVETLLGDKDLATEFVDGEFATIYLSPRDYHRIHAPLTGQLQKMIHIPGKLFSVNPVTVENVPELFARNERVVTVFDTAAGPMAVVLVGAIFVSSMDTVWAGTITPPRGRKIQHWDYNGEPSTKQNNELAFKLNKGDELGRFNMGSTVILLFPKGKTDWQKTFQVGSNVRMGQQIAKTI